MNPSWRRNLTGLQAVVQQAIGRVEVVSGSSPACQADLALQQVTLKRQRSSSPARAVTAQRLDETQAKERYRTPRGDRKKRRSRRPRRSPGRQSPKRKGSKRCWQYDKVVAPFDCVVTKRLSSCVWAAATPTPHGPLFTCQKLDVVRCSPTYRKASSRHPPRPATDIKLYGRPGSPSTAPSPASGRASSRNAHDASRNRPAEPRREAGAGDLCAGDAGARPQQGDPPKPQSLIERKGRRDVSRRFRWYVGPAYFFCRL